MTSTERELIEYTANKLYCGAVLFAVFYTLFAYYVHSIYESNFGGNRVSRNNKSSPSNLNMKPPKVKSQKSFQQRVLETEEAVPEANPKVGEKALHPVNEIKPHKTNTNKKSSQNQQEPQEGNPQEGERASELNMDHVYLNFLQLLWAFTFIGPMSYLLWKRKIFALQVRQVLVNAGIMKKQPVDMKLLVGKIILEQSQVVHYTSKKAYTDLKTSKVGMVGRFCFADFPYVDNYGAYKLAKNVTVHIDLGTKALVECTLDGEQLTPSQALIVLWFNTISAQHVKLHAMANWGINCDESVKEVNPFLHRNSIVTTIYNYFGFSSFPRFMKGWKKQGLLSAGWEPQALTDCFEHGVRENIVHHSQITELMPHSDFVNFTVKLRAIFHHEFSKCSHMFPGVDCEAFFAGTILHSLDHALMEWNLEDPLWLDVDDLKYGKMAELGRIVRVGFVEDIPGFYFHKRFGGSGHPFYESIYTKAARINKKFADHMDTCICR